MKHIKLAKKEYTIIETSELETMLSDLALFAVLCRKNAEEAKFHNENFATGMFLDNIITMSDSTSKYITRVRNEL